MKKGYYFIVAIVIALLLLSFHHLNYSMGDSIFRAVGLSPWTNKNNTGLHLPVAIGFVLLLIGFVGSVRYLRPKYPKILSRLVIGCIAFFLAFPFVTEKGMFLVKYNSKSIDSIDISKGNCSFKSEENKVIADCNFTMFNYGELDRIAIKPLLPNDYYNSVDIEFEKNILSMNKHSKQTINMKFNGIQRNGNGFSGTVHDVDFELDVNT